MARRQQPAKGITSPPPKAREERRESRKESPKQAVAPQNPNLPPGWREGKNGMLVNPNGKKFTPEQAETRPQMIKFRQQQMAGGELPDQYLAGLTPGQNVLINQRQEQDFDVGNIGGQMIDDIGAAYGNPFDWNALPNAPVQGDFNQWRQSQIDATYQDFNKRMEPQFKQQAEDFEQQMASRGIPMGSQLYEQQKKAMLQQQQDSRDSALTQAMGLAGQNAQQFYNIGTDARGNALNEGLMRRNMPLNEYNQIMASQSPMGMQNLGYSQQWNMQQDQQGHDRWMMRNQPRGGGGGGGGDPYGGYGSQEALWAAQDARAQANKMWEWQNNPQYRQQKGPSAGSQLFGQALGTGLGILGHSLF